MRRHLQDDSGAVAIIVAFMLVVVIGFSALVVDAGYWYDVRRQLQAAADGAALAGVQELILNGTHDEAWGAALEYAARNATKPGDGLEVVSRSTGGASDVTDTYVQVTVRKKASAFFGVFYGLSDNRISASARAQIAYVTGAKQVVPLSVPILQATKVTVRVGGVETPLGYDAGAKRWTGYVEVPSGAGLNGYRTDVIAYNDQVSAEYPDGVPLELNDAARLVRGPLSAPFEDVSIGDSFFTSGAGGSTTFRVRLDAAPVTHPVARFAGSTRTMSPVGGSTTEFSCSLPAPDIGSDLYGTFDVDVDVEMPADYAPGGAAGSIEAQAAEKDKGDGSGNGGGNGGGGGDGGATKKFSLDSAASVVVRRSTFPMKDVSVSPTFRRQGEGGSVAVTVELNDFEYGKAYDLKVASGGGEAGNFLALDLNTIRHGDVDHKSGPLEYPDLGSGGANSYRGYLGEGFPEALHIGDSVWTETGNMAGPSSQGCATRFSGDANRTFDAWVAAGEPGTKRLVYVPVVEAIGKNGSNPSAGTTPMRVVAMAAFYVEPAGGGSTGGDYVVRGRFVRYAAPASSISETPPETRYYIEVPHLVTPVVPAAP